MILEHWFLLACHNINLITQLLIHNDHINHWCCIANSDYFNYCGICFLLCLFLVTCLKWGISVNTQGYFWKDGLLVLKASTIHHELQHIFVIYYDLWGGKVNRVVNCKRGSHQVLKARWGMLLWCLLSFKARNTLLWLRSEHIWAFLLLFKNFLF